MELKLLQIKEAYGEKVNSPSAVVKLMQEEARADRECFWILHLNNTNRIIEKELVSMGTLNTSLAHPREVFKKTILNGAKSIITVHNHPGGKADPSDEDIKIWNRLDKAGKILGIEVADHIIVTPCGSHFSKRDRASCQLRRRLNYEK